MSGLDLNFGGKANQTKSQQKQAQVAETSLAKQLMFGSPQQQKYLAVAQMDENQLAEDQFIQDMTNLSDLQIAAKYGPTAARNRDGYIQQYRNTERQDNAPIPFNDAARDTAVSVAQGVANVAGAGLSLGLSAYDEVMANRTNTAELLAQGMEGVNEFFTDLKSGSSDNQNEIFQVRQALDAQEREASFGDIENPTLWDMVRREGQAFLDMAGNVAENPYVGMEMVGQAAGSFVPITAAARTAAAANVARKGIPNGLTKAQAVTREAERLVPAITAIVGGGSAGLQARQEILNMSEAELMESPEYRELRENGASHEDARSHLMKIASAPAELTGATIGLLAGKITARFQANPLGAGSIRQGATNTGMESLQEGIQEAGETFASNVGQKAAGLEGDLLEGTGEAAASGVLGGVGTAAAVQAPGAALSLTVDGARLTGKGAKALYEARKEQGDREIDEISPVGTAANARREEQVETDASALVSNQITPDQLSAQIQDAVYLSEEESAAFPDEMKAENGRVNRQGLIAGYAQALDNAELEDVDKAQYAIALLGARDEFRTLDNTASNEAAQALSETDNMRQRFERLKRNINAMESVPVFKTAEKLIQDMSPETVSNMFDFTDIEAGNLQTPAAKNTIDALQVIGRYNPLAVDLSKYDMVLEQVRGTEVDPEAVKAIQVSRDISETFQAADRASRAYRSKKDVREDILTQDNRDNDLPSIYLHQRNVLDALRSGRTEEAQEAFIDLREFARSQINKLGAFNRAAREGRSSAANGITYQAWGPWKKFFTQSPAWVNLNSPNSVALVRDIELDTRMVTDTFNSILENYPELAPTGQKKLVVPELDQSIVNSISAPTETDPVPVEKPERRVRSDFKGKKAYPIVEEGFTEEQENVRKRVRKHITKRKPAERRTPRKRPLVDELINAGITIDPDSAVGQELAALGITKGDVPGLLKEDGVYDIDNIPYGEIEYLTEVIPADETGNYYDREALLDAIITEANGTPVQDANEVELSRSEEERERAEREAEEVVETPEPKKEPAQKAKQTTPPETTPKQTKETKPVDDTPEVVTPQPEPQQEEAKAKRKSLKELFPDLQQADKGTNNFLNTFSLSDNKSNLLESDYPLESLVEEAEDLTPKQMKQLRLIRDDIYALVQSGLDEAVITKGKEPNKKWFRDLMEEVEGVLGYKNGLALNFTVTDFDGTVRFHPKVAAAVTMAVADWMIKSENTVPRKLDQAAINKKLGRKEDFALQTGDRQAVQHGPTMQSIFDDISQTTMRLLGVKADKNQPVKFSQGLFRALAGTTLEVLEENGFVDRNEHVYKTENGKRTYITFHMDRDRPALVEMTDVLRNQRDVFEKVFLDQPEPQFFFEPPQSVVNSVTRQRFNDVSNSEKKVIRKLQETPNNFVVPMLDLRSALGDDVFADVVGFTRDFNEDQTNEYDATRIKSKNLQITRALRAIDDHIAKAQEHAPDADLGSIDTFFKWSISSVGRLQQEGQVTPQGSKEAREMISATKAELDLNKQEHQDAVWLGAAQAFDISIEKQSHADTIAEIQDLFAGDLKPAFDLVRDWISSGELDGTQFKEAFLAADVEHTPKSLHALLTVARMQDALETQSEEVSSFVTHLALEADGKTDGPINAIINAGYGPFTPHQIKVMAKGGLMLGSTGMSLNDYIAGKEGQGNAQPHTGDLEDLYEITAQALERNLDLKGATPQAMALLGLMDEFLDGFGLVKGNTADETEAKIARKLVKNPLTVFLYGSGRKGIAGKMASAMKSEFQSMLTDLLQESPERASGFSRFQSNPELLENLQTFFGEDIRSILQNPRKGELSFDMMKHLTDSIDGLVGKPLEEAIDEATGGLRAAMLDVRLVTQIQALAFQDAFRQEIDKILPTRDGKRENLTENDYETAFQEASKVAPIYSNGVQEFHIVANEKYSSEHKISEALSGSYASGATITQPGDAGVKGQPYLVIGTGDGKMIINILQDGSPDLARSLMVFDGVELALDSFIPGSQSINEAVWKGWQEESVTGIAADGYAQFLRQFDPSKLSAEGKEAFKTFMKRTGVTDPRTGDTTKVKTVEELLRRASSNIQSRAAQNKARKRAMSRVQASIDHMAGANAPYENQGALPETNMQFDPQAVSDLLNKFYQEELEAERQKIRDAKKAPAIEAPTKEMTEFLQESGSRTTDPDLAKVTAVSGDAVISGLVQNKWFSKDQYRVFKDLFGSDLDLSDTTFYFGTPEELSKLRTEQGLPGTNEIQAGVSYPDRGIVLIANHTAETILHEALHLKTNKTLVDYYTDPESVAPEAANAIKRMEGLMNSFQDMVFEGSTGTDRAAQILQDELTRYKDEPIRQMAEFISWSLSNQNLIDEAKKTRVHSPLQKVVRGVLKFLKDMLGIKAPGKDLFSNVRFNAEVIVKMSGDNLSTLYEATLAAQTDGYFEQVYGDNPSLKKLERKFMTRTQTALRQSIDNDAEVSKLRKKAEYLRQYGSLEKMSRQSAERMEAAGYNMNQREKAAFMAIHQSMMTGYKLNTAAQRKVYDLYSELVNTAPTGSISALVGQGGILRNYENRSDLLATFVALGLVQKDFQDQLKDLKAPKNIADGDKSFDGRVIQAANTAVNYINQSAIGFGSAGTSIKSQLLALEDALAKIETDRRATAERLAFKPLEVMDSKISNLLDTGSKKAVKGIRSLRSANENRLQKLTFGAAEMVAALGSAEETEKQAEGMLAVINDLDGFNELRSLLNDLMGVTKTNADVLDLVNKVKSQVDAMRQDYREKIPQLLEERFSRKIKRDEWEQLMTGISETDLTALGQSEAMSLLGDLTKLDSEIQAAEAQVKDLGGRNGSRYLEKANALAHWMVNKEVISNNLLRNAEAIARLLNERGSVSDPDTSLVEAIDKLTTLYALKKTDKGTKDKLQELAQKEPEGMKFVIGYQWSTKGMELQRVAPGAEGEMSKLNGWKGYTPDTLTSGHQVIVVDDSEFEKWTKLGYERIGAYIGDSKERYRGTRSYMQTSVGGKAAFKQGIAQTVHQTYMGVDPKTGKTSSNRMAGVIRGKKAQNIAAKLGRIQNNLRGQEILIPVFDETGKVVAYERTMKPDMRKGLQEDKHMARMLGVWSGRIVEETQSDKFNETLVQTLKKTYDKALSDNNARGFINVADPDIKDPVIRDAWKTMGWKIKQDAAEIFGEPDTLWVRKDMIQDAIGFHQASVRDAWTGNTRLPESWQTGIKDVATTIFGKDAYKRMVQGEDIVSQVVSAAKTTIIVRSTVVMAGNIISNMLHLATWGLGPIEQAKQTRKKFLEISQYVKNQERTLELNAELAANIGNASKERRIKAELQAIEDLNKSLSIKPLLDAGEFSTISESLTEADVALRDGKISEYLEIAADKLPGAAQTAFKNFVLTKDTALFQGLNRAVQYGDFVAKAVLYDHLMKSKGYSEKQAMDVIKEEFVNYNRNAGRGRDYLENMGLLWFYNYKLRIMKVLARSLRERPASMLFWAGGVGPMTDIDTVASGSVAGAFLDGRLGYSIGPEMGYEGLFLNPWVNLTN